MPGHAPWKKGESGNPGGRPKGLGKAIREKYGEDGQQIINAFHALAFTKKVPAPVRLAALKEIVDRGWGKPLQPVGGDPEQPLELRVKFGGRYRPDGTG